MAGSPEPASELSFHKALEGLNYCIKISNGVALRNQKCALDVKLDKSSTVHVLEKEELEEEPFKDENLTDDIKQEATQSFIESEEEDLYQLITKDVKDEVKKFVKSQKESTVFGCDQCSYKTRKKRNLKTHVDAVHSGIRFPCDLCDYNALHRGDLKRHVTAKHLGTKFPCDQCSFQTSSKSYLNIHKNYIHYRFEIFM